VVVVAGMRARLGWPPREGLVVMAVVV